MPTQCEVILDQVPSDKEILVAKIIYRVLGLSPKDAKNLIKSAPITVMERVSTEKAETFQRELEQAGATVNIRKIASHKSSKSSQPHDAVELDEAAALNQYYSALASVDSTYQELLKAKNELNWYEDKLKEADELATQYGLQKPSKLSVPRLSLSTPLIRSKVESALAKGCIKTAEVQSIKIELTSTMSRLQKEFDNTISYLERQLKDTKAHLEQELKKTISSLENQLEKTLADISVNLKRIDALKTKIMIELLLIISTGVVTVIFTRNLMIVLVSMLATFIVRALMD